MDLYYTMNLSTPPRAMKKMLFATLVTLIGTCSFMYGMNPESSAMDDSARAIDYSGISTTFTYFPNPNISTNDSEIRAGLLYDVANKRIVWQKNMNSAFPIASLTKMMVAFLAVEDVNAGKFKWDDNVQWRRSYVMGRGKKRRIVYSTANYTLRDVFKAAMIASNNECAEEMARYIGYGNLQATIDRMNKRSRELGMFSTFYGNPTGLPAPHMMFDNSASPSDLLILTLEMLKYQEILDITKLGYAAILNGRSVIRNHNHLTIDYSGEVDGLKTGYTRRAGFCLVATTAKCDHRLVSIVLGCRGPQIRNTLVRDMFNDYYTSIGLDKLGPYCPSPLMTPQNAVAQMEITDGEYTFVKETVKKVHVVRRGENLSKIASKYKVSPDDVLNWNRKSMASGRVRAGQKLILYAQEIKKVKVAPVNGSETEDDQPLVVETTSSAPEEVATINKKPLTQKVVAEKKQNPKNYVIHTVEPGDTLFSIAQRYQGVTVSELKQLNNIKNSHTLKPGMKLKVKVQSEKA